MTELSVPDGFTRFDGHEQYDDGLGPVPGSGPIRACWVHNNDTYASRTSADGTAIETYKATAAGWELQVPGS